MKDFPNDTSFREEEQWFLSYDLYLCPYTSKVFVRTFVYFTQKVPHISIEKYTTNEQERKPFVHKK